MCFDGGNRIFVLIFISSMIRSFMSNFGADMWDVFVVCKIVYKIVDICFKFSHRSTVVQVHDSK